MESTIGALVDVDVIVTQCIADDTRPTSDFFNYLDNHRIGLLTEEIRNNARYRVRKQGPKYTGNKLSSIMRRFDDIDSRLKLEKIPFRKSEENLQKVRELFNDLFKEKGYTIPSMVPNYLRKTVSEVYLEQRTSIGDSIDKVFCEPILDEDLKVIATALTLKEKYKDMYVVSLDGHIIHENTSAAIKNRFGVTCGRPNEILQTIKDLSKGKSISNTCGL
jgi:hypothetical protein